MTAADDYGGDDALRADAERARGFSAGTPRLVPWRSIGDVLAAWAAKVPTRPFLVHVDDEAGTRTEWSYEKFECATNRCARLLHDEFGVRRGDRVGTLAFNHRDAVLLYFACWKLGAAVVPQNPSEDDARIAFALADAGCRTAFAMPDYLERLRAIAPAVEGLALVVALDADFVTRVDASSDGRVGEAPDRLDDDCLLVYTSGTTGAPKGVCLTQYHLLVDGEALTRWLSLDGDRRMMCVLPIHHVNGIVVTLVAPLYAGGSVVLNRTFKASTFWRRIDAEKVAVVSVVPTILQYLCEADENLSNVDLASLRYILCGAGTLAVGLAERFERRFGVPILHGYGLSETTAYACMLPPELGPDDHRRWLTQHGYPSIGCSLLGAELDIVDEAGRSLAPGERGEIVLRGHLVMNGYYRRPDANRDAFRGGWFHSGDEGMYRQDDAGRRYFFITGRIKELINRGGVKYSPFEIEEVLLECPGVRVGLAVAFDNDWYGEEIGAYVVADPATAPNERAVLDHCRARLPYAKCPKTVVFGTEVPVTATGKYQRLKLKSLFAAHRGTQFREAR